MLPIHPLPIHPLNPCIPNRSSIYHPSLPSIHIEKSHPDTRSAIHPSVSQPINHPSIQSASAEPGWSHQSGRVMWVMKRKRQIRRKPRSHDPHIILLWLTLWLLSSFRLHSPVSPSSLNPHCLNSWLIFSQRVDSGLSGDTNYCGWLWFAFLLLCLAFIHILLDSSRRVSRV